MYSKSLITALVMAACLSSEVAAKGGNGFKNKGGNNQNQQGQGQQQQQQAAAAQNTPTAAQGAAAAAGGQGGANNGLALNPAAVQTGSANNGAAGASAGQANSQTSNNNFINICAGKVLTNGLQQVGGSCNGIPMGDIPEQKNTPSTIITQPQNGQNVAAGQDLTMIANIQGIQTGTFTNPDNTYYSAPQALNQAGQIIGHTHFTVQDMGANANPQQALDPTKFAFFKGVDGAADGQGNVAVTAQGGLPAGNYRVCTMSASANHQPVIVAAAQRGSQDDCVRFTVGGAGGAQGAQGAQGAAGAAGAAQSAAAQQGAAGQQGAAAQQQQQQQQKGQGKGGKGKGKGGKRSVRFGRHARAARAEEEEE